MGKIISIQQRLHEDDLPAYLRDKCYACRCPPVIADLDMLVEIGPGRTHLYRRNVVLCPELMTREQLKQKRLESGPHVFSSQFLQDPVTLEGNLIRHDHSPRFERPIEREQFEKVFQSWNTATSALVNSV